MNSVESLCVTSNGFSYEHLSLFADRAEGDDVGARERDPEGADSDPSGGGAIVAAHVAQATHPGDTVDRTIALVDDARDALASAHERESGLLIDSRGDPSGKHRRTNTRESQTRFMTKTTSALYS